MANKCSTCGKFYSTATDGAKCTKCSILYHKPCCNFSPKTLANGKWLCKSCIPQKASAKVCDDECIDIYGDAMANTGESSLVQEIKLLRNELSTFREEMSHLSLVMSDHNKKLDNFEERLCRLESGSVDVEHSVTEEMISSLKTRLNDTEQENFANDVEITGVPESKGENLLHVTITLAQKLGLTLDERDIVNTYRAGPRVQTEKASDRPRPRPIVVRLTRYHLRNELLRAARVRRGADTGGLTLSGGEASRFYVNEHLTRTNRRLFYLTREQQRVKNWNYVWTRGGRIYARKDKQSRYFSISAESDITKVFG